MAEEKETPASPRLREKQSISVPFRWEVRPGTPKQEWNKSNLSPWITPPPSPLRLTISVPFSWEEKPGKPLPLLLTYPVTSDSSAPPAAYIAEDEFRGSSIEDSSSYNEDWYSLSETEDNGRSEADASALKFLFPLSLPSAGFLSKVCVQDRAIMPAAWEEKETKKSCREDRGRLVVKRTTTLEELILLSRKLSYRRPVIKKKIISMEFIRKSMVACFSVGTAGGPESVPITSI